MLKDVPPLTHLILILTYACQLRCKMCGQTAGPDDAPNSSNIRAQLPFELTRQRLDEVMSLRSANLFGGEPMLYRDLIPLLEYLSSRDIRIRFTTNGLLLNRFAAPIVRLRVEGVSVSIDSHKASVHDRIRGVEGCLEKALTGIDCLLGERKKAGSRRPSVQIHLTITPDNYWSLIEYYDHYANRFPELDQILFHFPRFATQAMGREYERIMREEFRTQALSWLGGFSDEDYNQGYARIDVDSIYDQLKVLLKRRKTVVIGPVERDEIRQYFYEPHVMPKNRACICFTSCAIQPNGDVVSCADFPDYVMGSIRDQTLLAIWGGERARHWREYLNTHDHPGVLVKCSRLYPHVRGGVYRLIPTSILSAAKQLKKSGPEHLTSA